MLCVREGEWRREQEGGEGQREGGEKQAHHVHLNEAFCELRMLVWLYLQAQGPMHADWLRLELSWGDVVMVDGAQRAGSKVQGLQSQLAQNMIM